MIYGRFGDPVTIVRVGRLEDVQLLDKRVPDAKDREAVKCGSYVVVRMNRDGDQREDGERLYHLAYLRADEGSAEIDRAIRALSAAAEYAAELERAEKTFKKIEGYRVQFAAAADEDEARRLHASVGRPLTKTETRVLAKVAAGGDPAGLVEVQACRRLEVQACRRLEARGLLTLEDSGYLAPGGESDGERWNAKLTDHGRAAAPSEGWLWRRRRFARARAATALPAERSAAASPPTAIRPSPSGAASCAGPTCTGSTSIPGSPPGEQHDHHEEDGSEDREALSAQRRVEAHEDERHDPPEPHLLPLPERVRRAHAGREERGPVQLLDGRSALRRRARAHARARRQRQQPTGQGSARAGPQARAGDVVRHPAGDQQLRDAATQFDMNNPLSVVREIALDLLGRHAPTAYTVEDVKKLFAWLSDEMEIDL